MVPIDVEDLSTENFKKFVDSFDYVFSDCDGVIWSTSPYPRAGEFFKLLKSMGKTIHFVSNNSLRSSEGYKKLFDATGIQNGVENLTIPSLAISEYLKSENFNKHAYCVTCAQCKTTLESNGIKCKYGPDVVKDNLYEFSEYIENDPEIGAVIFDSDYKVNIPKLYKAITYLKRPEVLFICGASDRTVPLKHGCLTLGTGVFTEIVEGETGRKAVLLGKPGKLFGQFAMKRAGVTDPTRVLFIGDMIEQDIGLGKATGFKTLLVLTSSTKEEMMSNETIRPDYFARSLTDIVPHLQRHASL